MSKYGVKRRCGDRRSRVGGSEIDTDGTFVHVLHFFVEKREGREGREKARWWWVVVVGGGSGGERKTRRDAPEVATRLMRSHAPTASARARPSHRLRYMSLCVRIQSRQYLHSSIALCFDQDQYVLH